MAPKPCVWAVALERGMPAICGPKRAYDTKRITTKDDQMSKPMTKPADKQVKFAIAKALKDVVNG